MSLDGGARALVAELDTLLDEDSWRQAWRRSRQVGPAAKSLIWTLLESDREPKRRLFWIGAFAAAAGRSAHEKLLHDAWFRAARRSEQVMALLAVSLGRGVGADGSDIFRLVGDSRSDAVRLAAAFAISRAATEFTPPSDWLSGAGQRDPGICAAIVLGGGELGRAAAERWLGTTDVPDAGAQLVWRALLLTNSPVAMDEGARLTLAHRAMSWDSELVRPLHRAASVRLARAADPGAWVSGKPSPWLLTALGSSAKGRDTLREASWLESFPSPQLDALTRGRLAAVFAISASQKEIEAAAARWQSDADLAAAACLGLAWRALSPGGALVGGPWLDALDETPESAWVRLAVGLDVPHTTRGVVGSRSVALEMAMAGRLTSSAMQVAVERELWRSGRHPGLASFECWMSLCRDLLLSGSHYARSQDARGADFPYLPADLQAGNREFFEVACEFFAWAVNERTEVPAGFGL